jgi:hypothetical protein
MLAGCGTALTEASITTMGPGGVPRHCPPVEQAVGQSIAWEAVIENTGNAEWPNTYVEILDASHFTIGHVDATSVEGTPTGHQGVYSFGPLAPGHRMTLLVSVTPIDAGNYSFGLSAWGDTTAESGPNGALQATCQVAVNPSANGSA